MRFGELYNIITFKSILNVTDEDKKIFNSLELNNPRQTASKSLYFLENCVIRKIKTDIKFIDNNDLINLNKCYSSSNNELPSCITKRDFDNIKYIYSKINNNDCLIFSDMNICGYYIIKLSFKLMNKHFSNSLNVINIVDINRMVFASTTYINYIFQMQERYLCDMTDLRKNCIDQNYQYNLKYIIFVVLYTLNILNKEKIVHNDLHPSNILLKSKKDIYPTETELTYSINDRIIKFDLSKIEFIPFITDWDLAVSYKHAFSIDLIFFNYPIYNNKEIISNHHIPNEFNQAFDIIIFINSIAFKYSNEKFNYLYINNKFIDNKIYDWLSELLNYIYSEIDGDDICSKIMNANKIEYINSKYEKDHTNSHFVNCKILDTKFKDKTALNVLLKLIEYI